MPRRIDAGEVLAAVGGVLVFVSLYLTWFELEGFADVSGFESFEALDLVLAVLAIAAVWSAVASTLALDSAPPPRLLPLLGLAIVLIVGVQLIDPPFFAQVDADPAVGAWLALSGGALVLLGGALRSARISVTVSVGGRDVRRRVPAVDRRPTATSPTPPPPPPPAAPEADPDATQPFTPAEER